MNRLLPLLWTFALAAAATGGEITVFAAASLTDALKEIAASYEKNSGHKIRFNFAASNTLAQQIQAGAPADVFFSADEAKMDALAAAGLISEGSRRNVLGNSLVVITARDGPSIGTLRDLTNPSIRYLSLADPAAVPAGIYAKDLLEKEGCWDAVKSKVVPAENVRTALAVVASGNAEAGIVYKTDAAISKKIKVVLEIPIEQGPNIRYPIALLKDSRHKADAQRFLDYLNGKSAADVFEKSGFIVLE
jgi:molybdate transport system substrate-binding protein